MTSDEIQLHLTSGKQAIKLSLAWEDKLSFVLDDKLVIKGLKFEDLLQEQAAQDGGDDDLGQMDASFLARTHHATSVKSWRARLRPAKGCPKDGWISHIHPRRSRSSKR